MLHGYAGEVAEADGCAWVLVEASWTAHSLAEYEAARKRPWASAAGR